MTKLLSLGRSLSLGLLVAFIGQASWALAGTSGNISGIVRDAKTGAPIAGVSLRITSGSQTVDTTTDASGHFVVFALQPDDYTLTAEKPGYGAQSITGYSVYADQSEVCDFQLTPAAEAAPGQ
jgi:hypothetical protein